MSQLNIRGLDESTCRAFKSQAAARGETLSEYLAYLVSCESHPMLYGWVDSDGTVSVSDGDERSGA